MTTRRLLALGAIATLAVGAAACSPDDAEETPTAVPTTTASESPTASAEETTTAETSIPSIPPPDPADYPGKDERTEEGAKQAARYYWAVMFWGLQTGNDDEFETLFTDNCVNCAGNLETIRQIGEDGNPWGSTSLEDVDLGSRRNVDGYEYVIDYYFIVSEHEVHTGGTEPPTVEPARQYNTAVGMVWEGGWLVDAVHLEFPDEQD